MLLAQPNTQTMILAISNKHGPPVKKKRLVVNNAVRPSLNMHHPELTAIYRKHFSECSKTINQVISSDAEPPADPLLISPPTKYFDSDFKIMYFGQEANRWEGPFHDSKGVDHLLDVYDKFANGSQYGARGPFWNAIKQLNRSFSQLHASPSFTYNNIIKIGKFVSKGLPSEPILRWQKTWYQVIREEIRILTPDLIIFFTGPRYNEFLQEAFGPIEFSQAGARSTRQLSRARAQGLPVNTFRTCHPNYLWRHDFYSYERDIIDASRAYQTVLGGGTTTTRRPTPKPPDCC